MHHTSPPSRRTTHACVALLLVMGAGCDGDADAFRQPTYADTQSQGLFVFGQAQLQPDTCAPDLNADPHPNSLLDLALSEQYVLTPKLYNERDEPMLVTHATVTIHPNPLIPNTTKVTVTHPSSGYIPPKEYGTTDIIAVSRGNAYDALISPTWYVLAQDADPSARAEVQMDIEITAQGARTGYLYRASHTTTLSLCFGCLVSFTANDLENNTCVVTSPFGMDGTGSVMAELRACRVGQDTPIDCRACLTKRAFDPYDPCQPYQQSPY